MNLLVERLALLYGEPKTPDVAAYINAYTNAFVGIERPVLEVAADAITKTRKISSWPTIGECLDAIEMAKKQVKAGGLRLQPIENFDAWYGGLMSQISLADNDGQINDAIEKIRPYANAMWCFPYRLTDAQKAADKRRQQWKETSAANRSRAMTGDRS